VYVDDRDAAYAITEHLIQLGHQRIGFLWGGREHRSSQERYQGYEDALKDYGVALDRKLIVPGDYTFDDGFRGARKLLALKDRPSAVFGSNDEIAAGVLAAAHSDGINVPYELSIAGFEDSPFSKQSWPALTTARQATEEIARHAAQRLIDDLQRAANGEAVNSINEGFSPELVVRGSTAPRHTAPSGRGAARRRKPTT
jgi:LacI family transcriptional regulator